MRLRGLDKNLAKVSTFVTLASVILFAQKIIAEGKGYIAWIEKTKGTNWCFCIDYSKKIFIIRWNVCAPYVATNVACIYDIYLQIPVLIGHKNKHTLRVILTALNSFLICIFMCSNNSY